MKAIVVTEEGTFAEYEDGRVLMGAPPSPAHRWDAAARRYVLAADLAWARVREKRKPLLEAADNGVNRAEDTGGNVAAWRAYRQALRNVTSQPDPLAVVWPQEPAA
jgi:hypothetical protein